MKALFVGSFDPFTKGHYEVLKQAESIFDEVLVVIATNPTKKRRFEHSISKQCIESIIGRRTKVICSDALTPLLYTSYGCDYIVRGLRNTTDYLWEEQLFQMYKQINPKIKVMYLRAENNISSTMVYELYKRGMSVDEFLPYESNMLLEVVEKHVMPLQHEHHWSIRD